MKTVDVRLGDSSYPIYIGSGLFKQIGRTLTENGFSGKLVIITNPVVNGLYGEVLVDNLTQAGFDVITLTVPDGEKYKSLSVAGRLYQNLTLANAERTTPILAVGGGVIGDLAGFVAATYQRGVPLVQVPTTLLAQVDASIGGKVAVDHNRLKNQIGVFYQPRLVVADIDTLKTLAPAEFVNGLAEVIKSAVVWDEDLFAFIEKNLDKIRALDAEMLEETVYRTASIKAEIVARDEKDTGLRNLLNFGHTIGHGIETASDFGMAHGSAVAIGMIAAGRISHELGLLSRNDLTRLHKIIQRAGLPVDMPDLNLKKVVKAMEHDKKILRGKIRFVLPQSLGKAIITDTVSPTLLERVLANWYEAA